MVIAPLLLTPENLSHLQAQHSPLHPPHHGVFLTPADADAAGPPSPGLASPVRSEYSWDDSYDCNGSFLFHDLADLIESHVARARANQPPPEAFGSRTAFNIHWTRVFADISQAAHLKATIPECLFLPRREFMRVKFEGLPPAAVANNGFDSAYFSSGPSSSADGHLRADSRSSFGSGSHHSHHSPEIFIEAPFGETITKEFFLHRIAEALYGEPAVGVAPLVGGDNDRPILLRFAWSKSNGGEHLKGPLTVYCDGLSSKGQSP